MSGMEGPLPTKTNEKRTEMNRFVATVILCGALLGDTAGFGAQPPAPAKSADAFKARADALATDYFKKTIPANIKSLDIEAIGTFLAAKELYDAGSYAECRDRLNAFWKRYPMGDTKVWGNDSWPTGYVALYMLTECARARTSADWFQGKPEPWRVTAVLIGKTAGSDLVADNLDARLSDPNFAERETHRATAFFGEYIRAITRGRLQMEVRVVELKNWKAPPNFREGSSMVLAVEEALPAEISRTTDCWWMMVRGLKPVAGFWGGTLVEDDGRQHFLNSDEWIQGNKARKGPPSDDEYAIGFTNWLLHEFYHYLIHSYSEFKLEEVDHQWWYREKWPADFKGEFETDYFAEALHKRIQAKGNPPIHVKLRYLPPEAAKLAVPK